MILYRNWVKAVSVAVQVVVQLHPNECRVIEMWYHLDWKRFLRGSECVVCSYCHPGQHVDLVL